MTSLATPPTRRGRAPRPPIPANGNAHADRPWPDRDRARAHADHAHWGAIFRRVTPCPRCGWSFVMLCPCAGRAL